MDHKQRGFTLIELVVVIVILGILAVIAIPRFVDLSADAKTAALNGVAGALSSANAVNYASRKLNATRGVQVNNCTSIAAALAGGLPSGYTITSAAVSLDTSVSCTVTYTPMSGGSVSTSFIATGIA